MPPQRRLKSKFERVYNKLMERLFPDPYERTALRRSKFDEYEDVRSGVMEDALQQVIDQARIVARAVAIRAGGYSKKRINSRKNRRTTRHARR